eukprot:g46896.t1
MAQDIAPAKGCKQPRSSGSRREGKSRTVRSNLLPLGPKGSDQPRRLHASNRLKTTKYTLLSFLPKNLFEQFHRFANVYFVFIALLNFVPIVGAFQPELALAPVVFILAVTALKDLWEDYRRYRSDQEINHMDCLSGGHAPVCINGAEVEMVETIRFLGVTLTNNLSWSTHYPCPFPYGMG